MKHPYLEDRSIRITPVEAGKKWDKLVVNASSKKNDPPMYKNTRKVYSAPFRSYNEGGGIKAVLDHSTKNACPDFKNELLTEREYFEKILGEDLNPLVRDHDENFWKSDLRGKLVVDAEGKNLNLRIPMDMLLFKIALSNEKSIARSPEEYKMFKRPSQLFMIVDQAKEEEKKIQSTLESAELSKLFVSKFNDYDEMVSILNIAGSLQPPNATMSQVQVSFTNFFNAKPYKLSEIVKDSLFKEKAMVMRAYATGLLTRRMGIYSLDTGQEIGKLDGAVSWFLNPENEMAVARVKEQIRKHTKQDIQEAVAEELVTLAGTGEVVENTLPEAGEVKVTEVSDNTSDNDSEGLSFDIPEE